MLSSSITSNDIIYHHLVYLTNILDNNNIKHWICYGTLLGAIRNNDIIINDDDFDIGILNKDVDTLLSIKLDPDYKITKKKPGCFYIFDKESINNNKWKKSKEDIWRLGLGLWYKNILIGDIFVYQIFNDGIMRKYCMSTKAYVMPYSYNIPAALVNNLNKIKIRENFFWIPQEPHILLEYWYGSDWIIPQSKDKLKLQNGYGYYGEPLNSKFELLQPFISTKEFINYPIWPQPIYYINWYNINTNLNFLKKY